jgi:hypothetical protein
VQELGATVRALPVAPDVRIRFIINEPIMLQAITPLPAIIAALIVGTDRRIVGKLRRENALSPESATVLPRRWGIWRWRIQRLIGRGALVRVPPDRVYLDQAGWQAYRTSRRRRVLIILAIVLSFAAFAFWRSIGAQGG